MGKQSFWRAMVAACVGTTGVVWAGPTGLNAMPTADVMGHREILVTYAFSGTERKISKKVNHVNGLEAGLFDRIELGVDNDFANTTTWNLKILLLEGKDSTWAISGGYMNGYDRQVDSYVVGRYDLKNLRLHAGWMQNADGGHAMGGVDFPIFGSATGMVEYLDGPNPYGYVGINWEIPRLPGFAVMGTVCIPKKSADGMTWAVTMTYGTRL